MDYEHRALLFAERYGIVEYKIKSNIMIYYEVFYEPNKSKYKCMVDLKTMKETRKRLYQ